VLTAADERRLHDAVSYDGRAADTCAPRVPAADAGGAFFWDGSERRSCADDSFEASASIRAGLYDAGTAVAGSMRIQVGKDSYSDPPVVYQWPLGTPIDQFLTENGETGSFRIDEAAAVAALRSLREHAIADAEASSGDFLGVIAVGSPGVDVSYFMSLRDELPFVGPEGSWLPAL
jgi:hypothetical protein